MSLSDIYTFFESRDVAIYLVHDELVYATASAELERDVDQFVREHYEQVRRFVSEQPRQFFHSARYSAEAPSLAKFRSGNRGNLFCIHPLPGSAWCYRQVAKGFRQAYSVYGVYAPGFGTHWEAPHLQELASLYSEQIRTIQPAGPYWVLGYSLGGLLAIDVARKLAEAGAKVHPVLVIDTRRLDTTTRTPLSPRRPLLVPLPDDPGKQPEHVWEYFIGVYFGWALAARAMSDRRFVERNWESRLEYLIDEGQRLELLDRWWSRHDARKIFLFLTKLMREAASYRLEQFSGNVVYCFSSAEIEHTYVLDFLSVVSGDRRLVQCPGDHISMMWESANAVGLGERLSAIMAHYDDADAGFEQN